MRRALGRLACRWGLHAPDACSGVGPCLRPGCGHVTHARALRGGGWRKHSVPPRSAQQRPKGLPPR